MTVQVHTAGPGVEDYRSTRFAATVNGTAAYVYGVRRTTEFYSFGLWEAGDEVEWSGFTYGADETTTVVVSLVSGSITSAIVYPKEHGITATVAGGTATITVTVGNLLKPLRVEVNGDPANVLYVHPHGLKSSAPGGAVTYDTSQASVPTGTSLRFPAGVWDLADSAYGSNVGFPIESDTTIYLDEGAVVIGTLSLVPGDAMSTGVTIRGPGMLLGSFADNEDLPQVYEQDIEYAMVFGELIGEAGSGNSISECMIVRSPFYAIGGTAINSIEDVHIYSPWTNNTDGMRCIGDAANSNRWTITRGSIWVGDDAMVVEHFSRHGTITELFAISSYSSALNLGYQSPDIDYGWTTTVEGFYTIPVQGYYGTQDGAEGGAIIQCWVDETTAGGAAGHGRYRVSIDGLYVEGATMQCPLFSFKNKPNPWGTSYDAAGNIAQFTLANIEVEATPATRSKLIGLDADNTPHDITFTDLTIGGVAVTSTNWSTFVEQNAYPYNITIESTEVEGLEPEASFVVETGAGSSTSNALCTVEFVDNYNRTYENASGWTSSSSAEKKEAIRLMTRWVSRRRQYDGKKVKTDQALAFPRYSLYDEDGWPESYTAVPISVQEAVAYGAIRIRLGTWSPFPDEASEGQVASESISVGPISLSTSFQGAKNTNPEVRLPLVDRLLAPYLLKKPNTLAR